MPRSVKYVNYLLNRKSFPDFLKAMNYKVDTKEWTECVGMLNRVKAACEDFTPNIIYDVGCGKRPTFAVLAALNLKSVLSFVAIDPQLDESTGKGIQKLFLRRQILSVYVDYLPKQRNITALIVCNHAHVKKQDIFELSKKFDQVKYITCPCCVDNRFNGPAIYYRDRHVWSPKNEYYTFTLK